MARLSSTVVVLVLLAATSAAFAITEGAKLELSPIAGTVVRPALFSPVGTHPAVHIDFRVRNSERVEAWIERGDTRIATILPARSVRAHTTLRLVWDGLSDDGISQGDGTYRPVVKLFRSHRTITIPSPITIDTKPPRIALRKVPHAIISPDGDGHADTFRAPYRVDEPAHGILSVDGERVEFTLGQKLAADLLWNGKLGKPARPVAPGLYVLRASAQDRAGNVSKPFVFAIVQVRYVVLARTRVTVRPGGRFALRVSTDAPTVHWVLHGRSGYQRRGTLVLRAPRKRGVYRLYVDAAGHAAKCTVVVA